MNEDFRRKCHRMGGALTCIQKEGDKGNLRLDPALMGGRENRISVEVASDFPLAKELYRNPEDWDLPPAALNADVERKIKALSSFPTSSKNLCYNSICLKLNYQ